MLVAKFGCRWLPHCRANENAWGVQAAAAVLTHALVDIHDYAAEVPGSEKDDPAFNSWIAEVAGKLALSDEVHVHWTDSRGKIERGPKAGIPASTLLSQSVRTSSACSIREHALLASASVGSLDGYNPGL